MADPIDRFYDPADAARHRYGCHPEIWRKLAGRRYWITGGGTGYGAAVATALAQAGAHATISGRRAAVLEQKASEIQNLNVPGKVTALPLDVLKPHDIENARDRLVAGGPIDGILAAAALAEPPAGAAPLRDVAADDWDLLMETNVRGPWLTVRAFLDHFGKAGTGRAILFSSTAGWHSTPGFGPYNISKAALNALGANLAAEAAASYPNADIRITVLDPGEAGTEMNKESPVSPFTVVPMALRLLGDDAGVENGSAYHRDGRKLPNNAEYRRKKRHWLLRRLGKQAMR